ncbi:hypothetical protein CDL15_Pgr005220 [Punica granatum]|uniref:F-box domain-containing protein n=1 Tax=Punica granatum TaxID=22663 RepID=A0A218WQJ6_PUNGR|nr:hypothetical protein CDL15_Pgr005220 [Punica granatum]
MKQSSSQSDGPHLPEEMIYEILVRLPVKSLCRFRCVSTLWRTIISDPHFVSSHLARSSAHPKLLFSGDEFADMDGTGTSMRKGKFLFSADYPRNYSEE